MHSEVIPLHIQGLYYMALRIQPRSQRKKALLGFISKMAKSKEKIKYPAMEIERQKVRTILGGK